MSKILTDNGGRQMVLSPIQGSVPEGTKFTAAVCQKQGPNLEGPLLRAMLKSEIIDHLFCDWNTKAGSISDTGFQG